MLLSVVKAQVMESCFILVKWLLIFFSRSHPVKAIIIACGSLFKNNLHLIIKHSFGDYKDVNKGCKGNPANM